MRSKLAPVATVLLGAAMIATVPGAQALAEDIAVDGGTIRLVLEREALPPNDSPADPWPGACANVGKRLLVGKGPWRFGVFDHFACAVEGQTPGTAAGPWEVRAHDDGKALRLVLRWTAPRAGANGVRCQTDLTEVQLPSGPKGLQLLRVREFADLLALALLDSMPMAMPARLATPLPNTASPRSGWPPEPTGFTRFDLAYDLDQCLWRASNAAGIWAHALTGRRARLAMETTALADASLRLLAPRPAGTAGATARPAAARSKIMLLSRGGAPALRGAGLLSRIPYLAARAGLSPDGLQGPALDLEGLPGVVTSNMDELGWWHADLSWAAGMTLGPVTLSAGPELAIWNFKARHGPDGVDLATLPALGAEFGAHYANDLAAATLRFGGERAAAVHSADTISSGAVELDGGPSHAWSPTPTVKLRPTAFVRAVTIEVSAAAKGNAGGAPTVLDLSQIYIGAGLCAIW